MRCGSRVAPPDLNIASGRAEIERLRRRLLFRPVEPGDQLSQLDRGRPSGLHRGGCAALFDEEFIIGEMGRIGKTLKIRAFILDILIILIYVIIK